LAEYRPRIEQMDRDELRDLIEELNLQIQKSVHSGTQCFHAAMRADERKQKAQNRLNELEDFPTQQQKSSSITNAFE